MPVGEVFLKADRMGSSISGLLDALSMAVSVGLQSGVPLRWFVDKLRNMQFEPSGTVVDDPDLKKATSVVDVVARWLGKRFLRAGGVDDVPKESP
jgi:ribonucleoside-diphosphate reductase alpha chain